MDRKFKNRFAGFKSSSFASSNSPKAFLKSSVYLTIAKVVKAAASGTGARRHTGDCQQRLEQWIHDDEVLRVRLDLCHVGLNRDAGCEKTQTSRRIEGV